MFAFTVEASASCPAGGAVCEQWATSAIASSEYASTAWSASGHGQPIRWCVFEDMDEDSPGLPEFQ